MFSCLENNLIKFDRTDRYITYETVESSSNAQVVVINTHQSNLTLQQGGQEVYFSKFSYYAFLVFNILIVWGEKYLVKSIAV